MHQQTAKAHALAYIERHKLTRKTCTEAVHQGYGGPGEPGYTIKHGTIMVPGIGYGIHGHVFLTNDLFDELEQGQQDLFGGVAA